jgi:hypothetical protein
LVSTIAVAFKNPILATFFNCGLNAETIVTTLSGILSTEYFFNGKLVIVVNGVIVSVIL